jgi:hypothetical protein
MRFQVAFPQQATAANGANTELANEMPVQSTRFIVIGDYPDFADLFCDLREENW